MSNVETEQLKSALDPTIPFFTRPENFLLAQIRHDTLLEFAHLTKQITIENQDATNNLTYRLQSPSAPLRIVPPSTRVTVPEWTSYIEINPNNVTGKGLLEMDLVQIKDSRKLNNVK